MKIGDKVMRTPQTIHGEDASGKSKAVPMKGTVEFACGGGHCPGEFSGY